MSFLEIQFPTQLALRAVGGPTYSTLINMGFSGFEARNKNWSRSRAEYTVSFEHRQQPDYDQLLAMFHAASGMANGFRLFDPSDYVFTNEPLLSTTGGMVLAKTYTVAGVTTRRAIQKPIMTGVKDFYGNALANTVTGAGSIDYTTGIVTGGSGNYSGHFHVPVRFDLDGLRSIKETPPANGLGILYTITGIKMIELKIPYGQAA